MNRTDQFQRKPGFIAALDQSGGSTPGTLARYGIPETAYQGDEAMYEHVHSMRIRILTAPAFSGQHILATILFQGTADRDVNGSPLPRWLWDELGILPILKVDIGLADAKDGMQFMLPIPDLDDTLAAARERGIFGTKMRSVIAGWSEDGIRALVDQQFDYACRISACGLVPIVEPEVSISCPEKQRCEERLVEEITSRLDALTGTTRVALKLTLPDIDNQYKDLIQHPRVVRVTALSGGYDQDQACRRLAANTGMIASFSRAFTEGLRVDQSDEEFNEILASSIRSIYAASIT
ncbi:MAG: fructose bisphosphate aldolase [Rhodobacteraceae bacterium]|nr:fructose bisphosphate aldolase [Paracoccaceae bacterium]